MVGRELASRFFEDRTRPRTTVRSTVRPDTNVLHPVIHMRTTQVPHRQASTPRPPHVMFLTRPSPSLAIFLRVTLRACGGRPGNEASIIIHTLYYILVVFLHMWLLSRTDTCAMSTANSVSVSRGAWFRGRV